MGMTMEMIFVSFLFYSFLGWCWESIILNFIQEKTFVNRGFLLGPYCPIYGTACVCSYVLLSHVENPLVLFFVSAMICSLVEYVTSYTMEKLFHARWWDYSELPLNINGRVCLLAASFFGICCTMICLRIEPWFLSLFRNVKAFYLQLFCSLVIVLFLIDFVTTIITWSHFNGHLDAIHAKLKDESNERLEELAERFADTEFVRLVEKNKIQIHINDLEVEMKKNELRFMNAFPRLKMNDYDLLSSIRFDEYIKNVTKKKNKK